MKNTALLKKHLLFIIIAVGMLVAPLFTNAYQLRILIFAALAMIFGLMSS